MRRRTDERAFASRGVSARSGPPAEAADPAHVIADLSLNHVERFVLRCGHTTEQFRHDYGIDLILFFHEEGTGLAADGQVYLQLKASDRPRQSMADGHRRADRPTRL